MSDGTVTSYGYSTGFWGDMLTSYNGTAITYDGVGNPLNWRNATALSWEKRELQKVTFSANSYVQYEYNSDGIRLSKSYINPSNYYREDRDYVLDGTKIIKEHIYVSTLAGITNTDIYYVYDASGDVIGLHYNNALYTFQKNLQGDVVRIINSTGTVVVEYTYDAWGKVLTTTGTLASTVGKYNSFRYRGYFFDNEIGLYYLQSRYYDPSIARFVNADDVGFVLYFDTEHSNICSYCSNNPTNDIDSNGFASYRTKSKNMNKLINAIGKAIPNIYTDDIWHKEKTILKIGTGNLSLTISCGAAAQTNKNALFGAMFKKGTLEVSSFFGINEYVAFAFSAGINWRKAYLKAGLGISLSKGPSGMFVAANIELSIPTWVLAAATVAVGIACIYAPAIGAYIAKIIATIRSSIRVAAGALVTLFPTIVKAVA